MKYRPLHGLLLLLCSLPLQATEVTRDAWVDDMRGIIPVTFCGSEQYFRQCFDVTAEQCEETMASAARVCLGQFENQIPDVLVQPGDGTRWGVVVGRCVGTSYEAAHLDKRSTEGACGDPASWQQ